MTTTTRESQSTTTIVDSTTALLPTYKRAPITFVRGEGVELIDSNGKRYLDFASGIAVNALGYGDHGISQAIIAALEAFGQHIEKSGVASAQNNMVGNKRALQLRNGVFHLAHPVLLTQTIQSRLTEPFFNDLVVAIGQITQLERE